MTPDLEQRTRRVIGIRHDLSHDLRKALDYLTCDPSASLTKSRRVLERLVIKRYQQVLNELPAKPMLGTLLTDKRFSDALPRRIVARIDAVMKILNLGPHIEAVDALDSRRALEQVLDIIDWDTEQPPHEADAPPSAESVEVEILPRLKTKYGEYLRAGLVSVKFVQSSNRCQLQMTLRDVKAGYLLDETVTRTDLGFLVEDIQTRRLFFDPGSPIEENARRFIDELNELGIVHCTDLFDETIAEAMYPKWLREGT